MNCGFEEWKRLSWTQKICKLNQSLYSLYLPHNENGVIGEEYDKFYSFKIVLRRLTDPAGRFILAPSAKHIFHHILHEIMKQLHFYFIL